MRDLDYSAAVDFLVRFYEGTEHAVEIRALPQEHGAGRGAPLFTRDPDLVVAHCVRWDGPDRAVYFGCCTRLTGAPGGKREDLAELIALWADIDVYKLGLDKGAVIAALRSLPFPPSIFVDSGGGLHCYWLLKEAIDVRQGIDGWEAVEHDVVAVLKQLAGVCAGDIGVCDLARVLRLPGTHNTKDGGLRLVSVLPAVSSWARYEFSDIVEMLDTQRPVVERPVRAEIAHTETPPNPFLEFATKYSIGSRVDVGQRLAAMTYGALDERSIHLTRLSVTSSLAALGVEDEAIFDLLLKETRRAAGPLAEHWNWKREERTIREEMRSAERKYSPAAKVVSRGPATVVQLRGGGAQAEEADPSGDSEQIPKLAGFPLNDLGNAMRLITQHSTALRYVVGIGWHVWDGRRYEYDPAMVASRRLAHETVRAMLVQAFDAVARTKPQEESKKAGIKFAIGSGNTAKISGMLSQAEPHLAVQADALNADPWLLNCSNGTVDLRTGAMQPHAQSDLITKMVPVGYDPGAECPNWLRFLSEIFAGDEAMIAFVHRALGYSLSGNVREQVIFIMHGGGANGKSVLLEVIAALLYDYASHCPSNTFTSNEIGGSGIPNDVARLAGARFVSIVETEHDKKLAEGLVKQATGGDRLTARFMRQEFFEFTPRFKIWLATNHKPRIRGTDNAIWRRIRLLPFNVTFVDKEGALPGQPIKDLDLKDKLLAELPGILRWMVEGCAAWLAEGGLKPPVAVSEATKEYRESQDIVAGFVDDACNVDPGIECASGALYDAYKKWCIENGERTIASSEFNASLSEKGYIPRKGTGGTRMRKGLNLRPVFDGKADH